MTQNRAEEKSFIQTPFLSDPVWVSVAKWVRIRSGNKYIADSRQVMLKRTFPMVYYFPRKDVNMELLEKAEESSRNDEWGNPARWHVNTGEKKVENAAWSYEKPSDKAPEDIENYIAFEWDAMDMWLEEDEEVRVHPRDPYHRIDVCNSSRHVRIVVSGHTVAETRRPVLLFETGLPVRFYIPKTDVKLDLLKPTDHQSYCPYKGTASYYSVVTHEEQLENVVWTYPFPNTEVIKIKDLVAFFTEKLDDVFIDGKKMEKVKTKWSD